MQRLSLPVVAVLMTACLLWWGATSTALAQDEWGLEAGPKDDPNRGQPGASDDGAIAMPGDEDQPEEEGPETLWVEHPDADLGPMPWEYIGINVGVSIDYYRQTANLFRREVTTGGVTTVSETFDFDPLTEDDTTTYFDIGEVGPQAWLQIPLGMNAYVCPMLGINYVYFKWAEVRNEADSNTQGTAFYDESTIVDGLGISLGGEAYYWDTEGYEGVFAAGRFYLNWMTLGSDYEDTTGDVELSVSRIIGELGARGGMMFDREMGMYLDAWWAFLLQFEITRESPVETVIENLHQYDLGFEVGGFFRLGEVILRPAISMTFSLAAVNGDTPNPDVNSAEAGRELNFGVTIELLYRLF